jgi:flagellar basal-body rod modification protein FlgD
MDVTKIALGATSAAPQSNRPATAAGGTGASLDYSAFLKLLIAQMQNQDPLEPMQSSDYVAQLATFSQVEKSVEMNSRLADLLSAVQLQQAEGLIGKIVTSADGLVGGEAHAAKIVDGKVVAVLADGREVAMGPGVLLSGRSA